MRPAAVFEDGSALSDDQLQRLAREMNLSETVILLPAEDGDVAASNAGASNAAAQPPHSRRGHPATTAGQLRLGWPAGPPKHKAPPLL